MTKICFIILHYLSTADTIHCVSSIKNLKKNNSDVPIIIVDNASPNGSGFLLYEQYKDDRDITVILNDKNEGFSKGNNIGCEYAKNHINPDFYVVLNNDIIIKQNDFCERIVELYNQYAYDILGPDIYNTYLKTHQNPLRNTLLTSDKVKKTIWFNKIIYYTYPFSIPIMWIVKHSENKSSKKERGYDKMHEKVCLHGSCLVLTSAYVNSKPKVFYPETFLYYEESLMMLWNTVNKKKSLYSPKISVLHAEGSATEMAAKGRVKRWYTGAKNIIDSAQTYLNELRGYSSEN